MKKIYFLISSILITTTFCFSQTGYYNISYKQTITSTNNYSDGKIVFLDPYLLGGIVPLTPDNCNPGVNVDAQIPNVLPYLCYVSTYCGGNTGDSYNIKTFDLDSTNWVYSAIKSRHDSIPLEIKLDTMYIGYNNLDTIEIEYYNFKNNKWKSIKSDIILSPKVYDTSKFDTLGYKTIVIMRYKKKKKLKKVKIFNINKNQTKIKQNKSFTTIESETNSFINGYYEVKNLSGQTLHKSYIKNEEILLINNKYVTGIYLIVIYPINNLPIMEKIIISN